MRAVEIQQRNVVYRYYQIPWSKFVEQFGIEGQVFNITIPNAIGEDNAFQKIPKGSLVEIVTETREEVTSK